MIVLVLVLAVVVVLAAVSAAAAEALLQLRAPPLLRLREHSSLERRAEAVGPCRRSACGTRPPDSLLQ